ncbi:MAG: hypothetical protein ABI134_04170 [Byssovorax sp.]
MKQPEIEDLPEFEEMFKKSIEKVRKAQIAELTLSERLEGLTLEQVLSTFSPEQLISVLPVDVLRALPEDYLRSLPAGAQEQVKKRLQGSAD